MSQRTPFPPVFWVANLIEVLERFSYYGIYFGFGIYLTSLGFSRDQLGIVQSLFLLVSYTVPIISGTMADRYGFKKILIISYLAYLPAILLMLVSKSFGGIATTMLLIAMAAGIFKPLISGTVRAVTDGTNKTIGFGIFYAMVNVGGTVGPIVAGKLRATSWENAFIASAAGIVAMLIVTVLFYREPSREESAKSLKETLGEIGTVLSDLKFTSFLVILGFGFWLPFWSFFNLCALYVDSSVDTAQLYLGMRGVVGAGVADFLSQVDETGTRRILGETISHTGWIIIFLQLSVSRVAERFRAMPVFNTGQIIAGLGFVVLGIAATGSPAIVFLGIFLFALGEMIASPRIQEYITWLAPKEKAGLYMGASFLSTAIGGLTSGIYTSVYGRFDAAGNPGGVMFVLGAHMVLSIGLIWIFGKVAGDFQEQSA
ncbi:MFS transporter [bacterium]|nr:MFS transporter [bacterium]